MKKLIVGIMAMLAITFNLSSFGQEKEAPNLDKMKEKIQKINDQMAMAMVKGDVEAGMAYYAEDVIYMPNYNKMIRGLEAMRKHDEQMGEREAKITAMKMTTTDLFKSGGLFYEIGTYELTILMPQSPSPINDQGKYLTIWEKQEDALKIKLEIWNTDVNPWSTMPAKVQEKDGGVEKAPAAATEQKGQTITKSGKKPVDPDSEKDPNKK